MGPAEWCPQWDLSVLAAGAGTPLSGLPDQKLVRLRVSLITVFGHVRGSGVRSGLRVILVGPYAVMAVMVTSGPVGGLGR